MHGVINENATRPLAVRRRFANKKDFVLAFAE